MWGKVLSLIKEEIQLLSKNFPKENLQNLLENHLLLTFDNVIITPHNAFNSVEALQRILKELDPEYYAKVDLKNPQRMSRALEVCLTTGEPYSALRKGNIKKRDFNIIKIGLNTEREVLYERINKRVDIMMQQGLLEEVKKLLPLRRSPHGQKHLNALQTVGYTELFDFLENKTDLNTAIDSIKQNTRKFAKRQLTWFRRDEEIKWFEPTQTTELIIYLTTKIHSPFEKGG